MTDRPIPTDRHREKALAWACENMRSMATYGSDGRTTEVVDAYAQACADTEAEIADEAERRARRLLDSAASMLKIADTGCVSTAARALAYSTLTRDIRSGSLRPKP